MAAARRGSITISELESQSVEIRNISSHADAFRQTSASSGVWRRRAGGWCQGAGDDSCLMTPRVRRSLKRESCLPHSFPVASYRKYTLHLYMNNWF